MKNQHMNLNEFKAIEEIKNFESNGIKKEEGQQLEDLMLKGGTEINQEEEEDLSVYDTSDKNFNFKNYFLKPLKTFEPLRLEGGMEASIADDNISISDQPEEEPFGQETSTKSKLLRQILHYIQQLILFILWLTFTIFLMMYKETDYDPIMLTVPVGKEGIKYRITKDIQGSSLYLRLQGPFTRNTFKFDELQSNDFDTYLAVQLQEVGKNGLERNIKSVLLFQVEQKNQDSKPLIEEVEKIIENLDKKHKYQLHFYSNTEKALALQVGYEFTKITKTSGLVLSILLLFLILMHVMFELIHRCLAGVVCCTLAIGIMAALHLRPSLQVVFNDWGNIDTIMIFFGISIIIEILAETGLQDHLAAISYKFSNGHIWPMLNCVLLVSFALSSLFNDILLVLFVAPICLRLCEIMQLNCTPILSCLIIAINVGSCLTPISSISNNMIANSPFIPQEKFDWGIFIAHMLPAAVLTLAQSYIQLRLQFRDSEKMRTFEPFHVIRLKHLIKLWRKAANRMGDYTLDDRFARKAVDKRVRSLRKRLQRLGKMPERPKGFVEKVKNLRENFPIQKVPLLIASLIALFMVLLFSVLTRFPNIINISNGWIAILAALLALSCTSYEDIEGIMSRLDWGTMLFFLTLFILMQVLILLGLLANIGLILKHFIIKASTNYRLSVAILSIIWISAILSTFMDNVPVADMMMRIIGTISRNEEIDLPIMPLVWSLALGCSFGANGSIVGAFANIACAGVASKHGYRLTFFGYFKIGFFIMLGNIVVASCYLLLVHVVFQWH